MSVLATLALTMAMAGVSAGATDPSAAGDAVARHLSVRLHDYTALSDDDLDATERQVSDIYAAIGVVLEWRTPVRPERIDAGLEDWPSDPAASLSVLVLPSARARGIGIRGDVAGYAAVGAQGHGTVAFVVADRTTFIARCARLAHPRVISQVIAHELAHLLMPNRPHSRNGLMRANWDPVDFRSDGTRRFSRAEADIIRHSVAQITERVQQADN